MRGKEKGEMRREEESEDGRGEEWRNHGRREGV